MSYAQATEALVNASNDPAGQRKLIRLAGTQTMSRAFGPGNFGYLTPTTGFFASGGVRPADGRWHWPGHGRIAADDLLEVERR